MDLSKEHSDDQSRSNSGKWIIPILFLLVLVVAGIRAYPWLNTKLQTLFPVQVERSSSATASQNTIGIELDTELSPIITDRDISLNESRSQQLTQFLSGLNGTPEIEVVLNSEDKILLAEAISPKEPELDLGNTASNVIAQHAPDTSETPKTPLITEVPQSDLIISSSPSQDSAQNIIQPATDIASAPEIPAITETPPPSDQTSKASEPQDNTQQAIAADTIQASSTLKTASLLPIAKTIPIAASDPGSNATQLAPALKTTEAVSISSSIKTTNPQETQSNTEIDTAKQQINARIVNWASAWSQQSVEQYFEFYTADMTTPLYKTHEKWRAWRQNRLRKPSQISLEINKVEIDLDSRDQNHATATFVQNYRTDNYSDKVVKLLELVKSGDRWLIKQEKSLETL